jgi:tetratricopeptide (TPR) repeat protein
MEGHAAIRSNAMTDTAAKARAMRLERLRAMLDGKLAQPRAALETLMAELRVGEAQPELWERLHAAAVRDAKEADLADAYGKIAHDRRLKQLSPAVHAEVLMHAADFFQGVRGDGEGAEGFLVGVLEVAPEHLEAFTRLERRFEASGDELRLVELYAAVAATPPKPADEMARRVLKIVTSLSAKTPISDDGCKGLLAFAPANLALLGALEAHCRKTGRIGLACELFEQAISKQGLPEVKVVELRRRLLELYMGEAGEPDKAISHVEVLLGRDPNDAQARATAERLIPRRKVASRAAAALQQARRSGRPVRS